MIIKRLPNPDLELYHHGIKGQRWGIRRYQNPDGSLTPEGKARYGTVENFERARRNKKIAAGIAIGAGTTVAAAATYLAAHKYIQENVDYTMKGSTLWRSGLEDVDPQPGRAYMTNNFFDKTVYQTWINNKVRNTPISAKTFKYKSDNIKVASNKTAKKYFENLYNNDSEFRKTVDDRMEEFRKAAHFGQLNTLTPDQIRQIKRSRSDSSSKYNAFNFLAVDSDPNMKAAFKKYYDSLKKDGYGAIHDINDTKLSGFNAKGAKIVFDMDKAKLVGEQTYNWKQANNMRESLNKKTQAIQYGRDNATAILATIGGVGIGGGAALNAISEQEAIKKGKQYNGSKETSRKSK